jgi:hypothetical protein
MRQSLPHGGGGMVRQSWYPCQCAEPNYGVHVAAEKASI